MGQPKKDDHADAGAEHLDPRQDEAMRWAIKANGILRLALIVYLIQSAPDAVVDAITKIMADSTVSQ